MSCCGTASALNARRSIPALTTELMTSSGCASRLSLSAAVAQILLDRVQDDLPNRTAGVGDRFVVARPILDRRARRKVELWPRHLMTINWADSGPGFSWPVAYKATYVPGFSRTVVTASADCPEMFGGVLRRRD